MVIRLIPAAALAAFAIFAVAPAAAQSGQDEARFQAAQDRFDREYQVYRQEVDRYQAARGRTGYYAPAPVPVPAYDNGGGYRRAPDYTTDDRYENGYDPSRYYRQGGQYQERVLSSNDRVYAGNDGRYYCKRSDGTTGLILGGAAGGILGNVIDGGHSRIVGTLLGGAVGALAGKSIDQNQSEVRCR
jgi:hypothetical protein